MASTESHKQRGALVGCTKIYMTNETRAWVAELAHDGVYGEKNSSPERIANHVLRGWSFLGVTQESHDRDKQEIILLVNQLRYIDPCR